MDYRRQRPLPRRHRPLVPSRHLPRRQRHLPLRHHKSLPQNTTKVLNSVDAIQTVVNRMIGYGYLTIDDENMLSSLQYGGDEEPVTSLPYLLRRFEK